LAVVLAPVSARDSSLTRAYAAWLVVCLVWGTTYLAIRIALETVPPMLMAGIRWVTAGALLVGFLAARGIRLPTPKSWPALAIIGIMMNSVGNGAVVWAELTVPSGLAALLVAAVPFWMVGVDRFLPKPDPVTRLRLAGLVVGFAGIILLVWPELTRPVGGGGMLAGAAAIQLACIGWAVGSSYSRRRRSHEHVVASAAIQMLAGGSVLLLIGLVVGEWRALSFNVRTFSATAYLVLAGSIAAFTAYQYALKHLPVATVSTYAYINPVIAVVLGTLALDEPFSPRLAVAGAIVLVGMMMVRRG
jgi:drug/metabolite transporter (DMT)-like permease